MEVAADELRALQADYLADVREKLDIMRAHGESLTARRQFKTSFPLLLFMSHQLKGSGGSMGFPEISDHAAAINAELNFFLESEGTDERLSPEQLSSSIVSAVDAMLAATTEAEGKLRGSELPQEA